MKKLKHALLVLFIPLIVAVVASPVSAQHRYFLRSEVLSENLGSPNIKIVDCRRSYDEYKKGHIPGAVYLNVLEKLRVPGRGGVAGVRRMLEEQEELFGRELGINNQSMVVLYDDSGLDATRLFWELAIAGHHNTALLYGGWTDWIEKELPISKEIPRVVPQPFIYDCNCQVLATANFILDNLGNPNVAIVDCRPLEEFLGKKKHPKAKVAGRIPGAINVHAQMNWENKTYPKPPDELLSEFEDLGITKDKTVIAYCNSGYMGANSWFILKVLGYPDVRCYDYSWFEWSQKDHLPKITPSL
ncbi:MAG: sulfurtransferase [Deltaproteobacteria bacterium]|nr:sulfurtransferase [Deltaproteobacteria bacterium]